MSASTQYTNLYNELGFVYVTGPSGTFPATAEEMRRWAYPDAGIPNYPEASQMIMEWVNANVPDNADGYATFIIEITNAAADNNTSVLVNGVAQTAGAIAMTVGDTAASAASIAAGINSYVPGAGPNYAATAIGSTILGRSTTLGSTPNGDVVSIAFSGASTATNTNVGGGRTLGEFPVRIWLDVSSSATESTMGVNAVEITDWLTHRGTESPRIGISASLVGNAISFEREGNDMVVTLSGTAVLNNIISIGVLNLDEITLEGDGATTQTLTASATIGLKGGSTYSITNTSTKITLQWDASGSKWNEVSRATLVDPALLRANGVAIPLQDGVFQITPAGGVALISPGLTGVSAFPGNVYEPNIVQVGAGVVLGSDLEYRVDAGSATDSDSGAIYGNGVPITVGANAVNFTDNNGIQATLTDELALSGLWAAYWTVTDQANDVVSFSVVPLFSTTNTQFLTTDMIKDANVTNVKLATGIDGAKISAGTLPETGLTAALAAKVNRLSPRGVVTLNNVIAVDGDSIFIDATVGNLVVTLPAIATNSFQRIVVTKTDSSLNTVTLSGDANIEKIASYVLSGFMNSVTIEGNGTEWFIVAVQPDISIECAVSITGLTTLDLTAANSHCRIVNVTSGNAAETITTIQNGPKNVTFEVRPENGLALTITGTAYGGAVNTVALQGVNIIIDGSLGEYICVKWDGNQYVYQYSNQGIV
jgi:hypothetical protein